MAGAGPDGADGRRSPARDIDAACDRFEAAWRSGDRPRIEDALVAAAEPDRPGLLRELIALERELRRGAGERPSPSDYRGRFSGLDAVVEAAFGTRPAPARSDADRNLLFGVLALQMDFIGREALIAAVSAWARDKRRPLAEILVERGDLPTTRRALLEPLVDEHLRAHGDDPGRSLAAVNPVGPPLSRDLDGLDDPDVHATLSRVGSSDHDGVPDPEATQAHAPRRAGDRYRILRRHARGGLGEVFVAQDDELHRQVALKAIQARHADAPEFRERFLREAELTGGLEHPGIVPVYSLGRHDDGRPYYAMRFIQGEDLKAAIARFHRGEGPGHGPSERARALRGLLGRFVAVCYAVAYAHDRGVLHRDLKPSNIMLGPYGETLVVDWGLAKVIGHPEAEPGSTEPTLRPPSASGSNPTQAGGPLGTPGYMSPEQAAGRHDELGPTSDIYSLGATLYCLLTGRAPLPGAVGTDEREAVRRRAERGDFPPPRQLAPGLDPALDAICLKAMALRPADRYRSARALADDLERWLADQPVSAYPEPWPRRASRWVRQHPARVAGATSLLATAVVALVVGLVLIGREQRRAEANFQLARQAVDRVLARFGEGLSPVPQMEDLRRKVHREALAFYRTFLERGGDDPEVRRGAALVLREVANVERMTNHFDEALVNYQQAVALLEGLLRESPRDLALRDRLAWTLLDLSALLRRMGRLGDSEPPLRRALALAGELRAEAPGPSIYRRTASHALLDLASLLRNRGRTAEALRSLDQALPMLEELAGANDRLPTDGVFLVMAFTSRGLLRAEQGRLSEAVDDLSRAVDRARAQVQAAPRDTNGQLTLADALSERGHLLTEARQTGRAKADLDEAVALLDRLASEHPRTTSYSRELALALDRRGRLRVAEGRTPEAEADFLRAKDVLEGLLEATPGVPRYLSYLGQCLGDLGRLALDRGESAEALDLLDRAIAAQEEALRANRDSPADRRALERHHADRDRAREALGGGPHPPGSTTTPSTDP